MLTRRHLLAVLAAGAVIRPDDAFADDAARTEGGAPLEFGPGEPFSWDRLVALAKQRLAAPFAPAKPIPRRRS